MTQPLEWPLLGRDGELDAVAEILAGLRGGRVLEVSGEPGIGKTRLLAELAARARSRGLLVLSGRATEFEREVPFGLFAEALDDHLTDVGPAELRRLAGDHAGRLGEVLPTLGTATGHRVLAAERYHLHRAVRALLDGLGRDRGVVLVLDDAHWADQASVECLVHLLRHPPRGKVLLALGARTGQLQAALTSAIADADSTVVRRLMLGPLPLAATSTLIGSGTATVRCRQLHERSDGNPFYLRALLAAPRPATGDNVPVTSTVAPGSGHAALVAELAALPPTRRLVAHAAAVAGEVFAPDLLASIAGLEPAVTFDAVDELIARDILRPTDGGHRLRFRHPIVRNAVYADAGPGWRRTAHTRAAAALERVGAPVTVRAHHVAESMPTNPEQAIDVLLAAAQAVHAGSPLDAARWLGAALNLLPPDSARRDELLLRRANALFVGGAVTDCRDLLLDLLSTARPGAHPGRLTAVTLCATAHRYLGRHPEARALLATELEALPAGDDLAAAALTVELAACAITERTDPDWQQLDEALAVATRHEDNALRIIVLSMRSLGAARSGAVLEARTCLDAATEVAEGLSDDALARRPDALVWLAWAAVPFTCPRDVSAHTRRGIEHARRYPNAQILVELLLFQARARCILGPVDQALADCDEALDAALLTPNLALHVQAYATKAWVAAFAGELETAVAAGRRTFDVPGAHRQLFSIYALSALLDVSHLTGDDLPGFVEQIMQDYRGDDFALDLPASMVPQARYTLALLKGDTDGALATADRVANNPVGNAVHTMMALLTQSQILRHRGERATPAAAARRSVEISEDYGFGPVAAKSHLVLGRALVADDDPDGAIAAFERSQELADAHNMTWLHAQAIRELRHLGRRVRSSIGQPNGLLTARESDVADLVAKGYTNHRIAEELVLSVRTVTTHVSHILAKLDVPSRAAVGTALKPGPCR